MNRVVLAISNHAAMLGGGEHSFYDLICRLPRDWRPVPVLPQSGELEERLKRNGISAEVVPLTQIRPWKVHSIISSITGFVRICRKIEPAIIYANGSRAALYGGIAGKLLKLPVVWHCRVAEKDPLDHILTKLCARIVVNSRATAARFAGRSRSKVRVVYNGLDLEWLSSPEIMQPCWIQKSWRIILVVARVSRLKGHDVVLSAFEDVAKKDPNAHLICLGARDEDEPDWWDELQVRTLKSTFSKQIHWQGQCDDVRPWYQAASVLVLASENEAFGRVVVEAMANSLPVVALASGGVPEIVRHGIEGFLVSPGCSHAMADAIGSLLLDEELRDRMGKSAKQRASAFSIEQHIRQMVQVFEETAKGIQGEVNGS